MSRPPRPTLAPAPARAAPAKIADVARIAGVSAATVSRALANPGMVAEQTRRRVIDAVRQTNYTPNVAARNLRERKTRMVLVVVPDIANPFFAEVLRGIDTALSMEGYGLIIANLDNSTDKAARYVDLACASQVDGVLLLCGHILNGPKRSLLAANLPIVAACERIPGADFPQVEVKNREASRAAVDYLLALGHRRIGYIAGHRTSILNAERHAGYAEALSARAIAVDRALQFPGDFSFQAGVRAAEATLAITPERRPTAVFAANDEMAIGFLKSVHAAGHRIPEDFSVIGFDAIEYADYCEPTLTTVFQPRRDIGAAAAALLIAMMADDAAPQPELIRLDATLRVRNSTGPCPDAA